MSQLIQKIIDNIQIKITNIYIRIEDTLSIPNQPFALGVVIGSMEAQTMSDAWVPEFIANKEITNKQFTIKDFAVYMNFSSDAREVVLFDHLTKEWTDAEDYDAKCRRFLMQECSFSNPNNNYVIERYSADMRIALNKNLKNMQPQIWANIVMGGIFKGAKHDIQSEFGKYFYFSAQQQQVAGLMKFLEYIGNYSKFQAGVLSVFYKRELTKDQENEYMKWYTLYKGYLANKEVKEAAFIKGRMENEYEKVYP